jgi:NADPH2:quinone reductase
MEAIQLEGYGGPVALDRVDVDRPSPKAGEVLIDVYASGINFAELELTWGRYEVPKKPPFIMGFEAAGVVAEVGFGVNNVQVGDRVTSIVSSGGFADYAVAPAQALIPIPASISFEEATTIPIQGVTAYLLLTAAAKINVGESVLIQSAAGGVGLYLVQLAKHLGARQVIALAGTKEKVDLLRRLGVDIALNHSDADWADAVLEATQGRGVDIVLESATGDIGRKSISLCADFGRVVMFGAKNVHEWLAVEVVRQMIYKNQSIRGFNLPSLRPETLAAAVPPLLELIGTKKIRIFADRSYSFADARQAFRRLAGGETIGKVVLTPNRRSRAAQ